MSRDIKTSLIIFFLIAIILSLLTSPSVLSASGAAAGSGTNLGSLRTPFGKRRFQFLGDKLMQRSMVEEGKEWELAADQG